MCFTSIWKPTPATSSSQGLNHNKALIWSLESRELGPWSAFSVDHFDAKFLDYFLPAEKTNSAKRQGTFCGTEGILPAFAYNKE
jgi:hypothetical protein